MFIAINRLARRQRRRLMMLSAVLALSGAVVAAHSVMGGDHMGDDAAMCVAVLEIAALAAAGIARPLRMARTARPARDPLAPVRPAMTFVPAPRARSSPLALQVFRL